MTPPYSDNTAGLSGPASSESTPAAAEEPAIHAVDGGAPRPPRRLLRGSEQLAHLVGGRLLVGITYRNHEGSVVRTDQFCGRVNEVIDGVVVVQRGDDHVILPADPHAYDVAPPGRYVLAGSKETIVDPDYVTVWDVQDQ